MHQQPSNRFQAIAREAFAHRGGFAFTASRIGGRERITFRNGGRSATFLLTHNRELAYPYCAKHNGSIAAVAATRAELMLQLQRNCEQLIG